jgi:hypothetical protein
MSQPWTGSSQASTSTHTLPPHHSPSLPPPGLFDAAASQAHHHPPGLAGKPTMSAPYFAAGELLSPVGPSLGGAGSMGRGPPLTPHRPDGGGFMGAPATRGAYGLSAPTTPWRS